MKNSSIKRYRKFTLCLLIVFIVQLVFVSGCAGAYSISGMKFNDLNKNGINDDDQWIPGWEIYNDSNDNGEWDTGEPETTTNSSGYYNLSFSSEGIKIIREVTNSNWNQTYPNNNHTAELNTSNPDVTGKDFGNYEDATYSWPNCNWGCTSGDVVLNALWLGDVNGNSIGSCTSGDFLNVYLWAILDNKGDTKVQTWVIFDLYINNIEEGQRSQCIGDLLGHRVESHRLYGPITIPCGANVTLADGTISWMTVGSCDCDDTPVCHGPGCKHNTAQCKNFLATASPQPPGSISGYKYWDKNGDGTIDPGDEPLTDWTIKLANVSYTPSYVTDENGFYIFEGLSADTYNVSEVVKPGWSPTNPSTGWQMVTLAENEIKTDVNFTNTPLLCIEGYKIDDCTGDGLNGWTINVSNETSDVASTTTNLTGWYQFCGLEPGTYTVCEVIESGWTNVTPTCIDVDLDCENVINKNFTNAENEYCLSGYKLNSRTDEPLSGWTITVRNSTGHLMGTDTTDATGQWEVCGLVNDTYTVCETNQTGWTPVNPASGCQSITIFGENVALHKVNFTNAENEYCLSGYKLNSRTGTGLKDWTITVTNTTTGATVDTNITNAIGWWQVCGLVNGTYTVCETNQTGWTPVDPASGCQDITISGEDAKLYKVNFTNAENEYCLSGYKLNSRTGDGLKNWTINVTNSSGLVGTVTTDVDGWWQVCHLINGTYTVCETNKTGWTPIDPASGCHNVTIAGETESLYKVNFSNAHHACMSGHKYDPVKNKMLSGWTIFIDTNGNSTLDFGERSTITDGNGYWEFCDLPPGDYMVCEVLKPGWTPIDPVTGCQPVTLRGEDVTDIDFSNGPWNFTITKIALQDTVKRGDEITYIISVCNIGGLPLHNITVRDVFGKYVIFVSASPMPDGDEIWRFAELPALSCMNITLKARVPDAARDLEFGMDQGIVGEGFVNVANDYSTTLQPYVITNCVYATSDEYHEISDCETVTVSGDLGTELSTRQHGSGTYDSEEEVKLLMKNKSIEMKKDVTADYKPTTLGLYRNRSITYDTKWIEKARAKNRITGTSMYEAYHYATHIDRDSYIKLDKNESTMTVDSEFDGQGHVGVLKKSHPGDTARDTPLFESREDYTGSFRIYENVNEYGSSIASDKSASGTGLVAAETRVKDNQKTYESGTGSYDSEEQIRTYTNYIAKDISLAHEPMNKSLTDDVSINASMKWKEGMWSKNPKTSLIGEEYTGIECLEKETTASGLNQMDTEAEFSGRAEYRAILRDEVDLDESYAGDYSIKRRVLFQGIPKYDHPHLNVTKVLVGIAKEKVGTKEVILTGENIDKIIDVATYEIIVENDGDRALHPIYVRDIFPPGSKYIDASVRPTELMSTSANWTLTHLSIGDVSTITLRLDVTEYRGDELVNRAEACGEYNGDMICGTNFSALEVDWLTCCLNETVHVTKTAQVDQNATNVVMYTLTIQNLEDCTRVAEVTDVLPEGMKLLDASIPPSSYVNGTVTWNLIDLAPRDTKKIIYRTEAHWSGHFVNEARVDLRSVDGTVVRPVYVSAAVAVGEFEGEKQAPGWQPPDWGIKLSCEECNDLTS